MTGFIQPPPARALTPEEAEERVALVRGLEDAIRAGLRATAAGIWATAKALHEFDEESGWTALGFTSKAAWLAGTNLPLSYGQVQQMIRVYRETVVRRGLDFERTKTLDLPKVDLVVPALRDGRVAVDDAIADVQAMPASALREKYANVPRPGTPAPSVTADDPDVPAVDVAAERDPVEADALIEPPARADRPEVDLTSAAASSVPVVLPPRAPAPITAPVLASRLHRAALLLRGLDVADSVEVSAEMLADLDDLSGAVEQLRALS